MKPQETIEFNIRSIWFKVARLYNLEASKYGVSMSIGMLLLNIEKEGTPSTRLGPKMGMEAHSLSRTIKTLEKKGFIYREQSVIDKRMVKIFLTPLGLEKRALAKKTVIQFNNKIQNQIDQNELDIFFKVSKQLDELLDKNEIFN